MAEHEVDGADGGLEPGRAVEQVGQSGDMRRAEVAQGGGVVADDVEDVEGEDRTPDMGEDVAVDAGDEVGGGVERRGVAQVGLRQRRRLDPVEHQRAGLGVMDARREAGGMGGAAERELVEAQDAVLGDVVAEAHDVVAAAVAQAQVEVGDAALQRADVLRGG